MEVIFDTNAYRRLAVGRQPGEIIELFRQIRKAEDIAAISTYMSPVVWLELFVHLADLTDPHLPDCMGAVIGSYLHSRVDEESMDFRLMHRADVVLAATLFEFQDAGEDRILVDFDRLAGLIYGRPGPEILVAHNEYLKGLRSFAEREEVTFMARFGELKEEFWQKYSGEKDIVKKMTNAGFGDRLAVFGVVKAATTAGVDVLKMTEAEIARCVGMIKDYFPAPSFLAMDIVTRMIDNEDFNIAKGSRRNWYWDYQMLFYISSHTDNLLVTDDKAMIDAAKAAEVGDKIIRLVDYLDKIGMAVELRPSVLKSVVSTGHIPVGQDISLEDIARHLGVPPYYLSPESLPEYRKAYAAAMESMEMVRRIISPFYEAAAKNAATNNDKHLEIVDAGKFIMITGLPIRLVETEERPDFVIEYNGDRIGVEHTQLVKKSEQHAVGKALTLLNWAANYVGKMRPDVTGLFDVCLLTDGAVYTGKEFMELTKREMSVVAGILGDYIISLYAETSGPTPGFIERASQYANNMLNIRLSEIFIRRQLEASVLAERIAEKECKVGQYKANKGLTACWLLVVHSLSVSSASFHIDPADLPVGHGVFDRIFIMDSFAETIIEANAGH